MAVYLTVKTASDGGFSQKSANALKKTACILVEKFNLTYSCFLYPYVDAHALYCNDVRMSVLGDLLVVRADGIDREKFARMITELKPLCGVCWYFSEGSAENPDPENTVYSTYGRSVRKKRENTFLFSAGTSPELFGSPDYIVREYSRRICTFMEIAVREVTRHEGEIVFCGGEKLCFASSAEGSVFIKNRLFDIFSEKMGEYARFSNKYFNKLMFY